jgi:hypothetical protein
VVATHRALVDRTAGVGHQLTGGGGQLPQIRPHRLEQRTDRVARDLAADAAGLGAHEVGPLVHPGDLVAGGDGGTGLPQGVDESLVARPARVDDHEDDALGGVGRLLDDRRGQLLADLLRREQDEHPPLGEERRAQALGQVGGGEFGGAHPAQLGRGVARTDLGHHLLDRPLDEQFLLADDEADRGGRGHASMLAHGPDIA